MQIRVGFDLTFECPQPTPMLLMLHIHPSRARDLVTADTLCSDPVLPLSEYIDTYGNRCGRIVLPAGLIRLSSNVIVADSGLPDSIRPEACQHEVAELPEHTLLFLLGSRYCDTDRLNEIAWSLFGDVPPGWQRVQAICDYVNSHVVYSYQYARATKTAWDVYCERGGVCRDFAHLAITLCRCMNIPARYCTGYLGDIGVPAKQSPPDFHAWFEAYLGYQWYSFDARYNAPRVGRILMARGRDAADVALSTSFGPNTLASFTVWADECHDPA